MNCSLWTEFTLNLSWSPKDLNYANPNPKNWTKIIRIRIEPISGTYASRLIIHFISVSSVFNHFPTFFSLVLVQNTVIIIFPSCQHVQGNFFIIPFNRTYDLLNWQTFYFFFSFLRLHQNTCCSMLHYISPWRYIFVKYIHTYDTSRTRVNVV